MKPFYELGPTDLLKKAQAETAEFYRSADLHTLFNALASLNHLREWICPGADEERRAQADWPASPAEQLFQELWDDSSYRVVRKLCNSAKHFSVSAGQPIASTVVGASVGLLRAGDSLRQTYRLADGEDLRIILMDVLRIYIEYFDVQDPGWSAA